MASESSRNPVAQVILVRIFNPIVTMTMTLTATLTVHFMADYDDSPNRCKQLHPRLLTIQASSRLSSKCSFNPPLIKEHSQSELGPGVVKYGASDQRSGNKAEHT